MGSYMYIFGAGEAMKVATNPVREGLKDKSSLDLDLEKYGEKQ